MPMRTFASKYFPESQSLRTLEETTLSVKNAHPEVLLKQIDFTERKAKSEGGPISGLKEATPELIKALHDLHIGGKYEKDGVPFYPPEPRNFYESARAFVHFLPHRVIDSPRSSAASSRRASPTSVVAADAQSSKRVRWADNLVDVREFDKDG